MPRALRSIRSAKNPNQQQDHQDEHDGAESDVHGFPFRLVGLLVPTPPQLETVSFAVRVGKPVCELLALVSHHPVERTNIMGITTSLILIAAGAIMRFAVTAQATGFSVHTVGVILMIVGIVGAVLSIAFWTSWGGYSRRTVVRTREPARPRNVSFAKATRPRLTDPMVGNREGMEPTTPRPDATQKRWRFGLYPASTPGPGDDTAPERTSPLAVRPVLAARLTRSENKGEVRLPCPGGGARTRQHTPRFWYDPNRKGSRLSPSSCLAPSAAGDTAPMLDGMEPPLDLQPPTPPPHPDRRRRLAAVLLVVVMARGAVTRLLDRARVAIRPRQPQAPPRWRHPHPRPGASTRRSSRSRRSKPRSIPRSSTSRRRSDVGNARRARAW